MAWVSVRVTFAQCPLWVASGGSSPRLLGLTLWRLYPGLVEQCRPSALALSRPSLSIVIELLSHIGSIREAHPSLFGTCIDVNVGRHPIRVIQCSDTDESDALFKTSHEIVAPDGDSTVWTASDDLPISARRSYSYLFDGPLKQLDSVSFYQRIVRKC